MSGESDRMVSTALFSDAEISAAKSLRADGLEWNPAVGHYCFDEGGLVEAPSPFQDRVYFILDLRHFLRRANTIERLVAEMCWIPTWRQTRDLLRARGITDQQVQKHLMDSDAISSGDELRILYQFLRDNLHSRG